MELFWEFYGILSNLKGFDGILLHGPMYEDFFARNGDLSNEYT